jgi:hypothetical protein
MKRSFLTAVPLLGVVSFTAGLANGSGPIVRECTNRDQDPGCIRCQDWQDGKRIGQPWVNCMPVPSGGGDDPSTPPGDDDDDDDDDDDGC